MQGDVAARGAAHLRGIGRSWLLQLLPLVGAVVGGVLGAHHLARLARILDRRPAAWLRLTAVLAAIGAAAGGVRFVQLVTDADPRLRQGVATACSALAALTYSLALLSWARATGATVLSRRLSFGLVALASGAAVAWVTLLVTGRPSADAAEVGTGLFGFGLVADGPAAVVAGLLAMAGGLTWLWVTIGAHWVVRRGLEELAAEGADRAIPVPT